MNAWLSFVAGMGLAFVILGFISVCREFMRGDGDGR